MAQLIIDGEVVCGGGAGVIMLSQEDYDALSETQKRNGIYITPGSNNLTAKNLSYDGSVTELGNNVQDAIDGLNEQNKKITVKDYYDNDLGTDLYQGYYYTEIDVTNHIALYGDIISTEIINSYQNIPVFTQVIAGSITTVRLLSAVQGCSSVGVRVVYYKK